MPRDLADLWRLYAETGAGPDAPTYRSIAHAVADDARLLAVVQACPPETHHPNHLLGAVRFMLLGGTRHPLADAYESRDPAGAVSLFRDFVLAHRAQLIDVLQHRRVQTNEIGRVAAIAPALAHVRDLAGGPLGLLDVGCSAGLNLLVDRCRLDYGTFRTGERESPIELRCDVATAPPAFDLDGLEIEWRQGLDRSPIDLDDEEAARWLLSCVWVDQRDRIDRLAQAIELSRAQQPTVVRGDAVEDLAAAVSRIPRHLHATVLTSWVAFYLSRQQRSAFERVLAGAGRPVSWVSLEHPNVVADLGQPEPPESQQIAPSVIGCVTFGEHETRREFLGWAHPHGRWLDWCAHQSDTAQT